MHLERSDHVLLLLLLLLLWHTLEQLTLHGIHRRYLGLQETWLRHPIETILRHVGLWLEHKVLLHLLHGHLESLLWSLSIVRALEEPRYELLEELLLVAILHELSIVVDAKLAWCHLHLVLLAHLHVAWSKLVHAWCSVHVVALYWVSLHRVP